MTINTGSAASGVRSLLRGFDHFEAIFKAIKLAIDARDYNTVRLLADLSITHAEQHADRADGIAEDLESAAAQQGDRI